MVISGLWLRLLVATLMAVALFACATPPVPARLQFLDYQGLVNEHDILIQAQPSRIFAMLTDHDQFATLVPSHRVLVSKVSPGPYGVGTIIRCETRYRVKLRWDSQVVEIHQDRRVVLQFLDGIFAGGYEVWELQPQGTCTRVSHTLVYNISNFFYQVLWVLKRGEHKHDTLTETTLMNLKKACETDLPTTAGAAH